MKKALTAMAIIASPLLLKAQNASEGAVKIMKAENSAAIATYDYPEEIVEKALTIKLEKEGLGKQRKQQGFLTYKGVSWPEVSSEKLDVYVKVESKKKGAIVSLLAAKGYDNFVSSSSDAATMEKMKQFLNEFATDVASYNDEIEEKEAELEKAKKAAEEHAKKQKKLESEHAKLAEELKKAKKAN
ncbi:hypothetical protein GFS24_01395 [Chitinophaga sp. SYP-B3965]|uniref:hypothetical protein n=1 Tax=Chitinophaga sp. SYP-B3965 TaxID=2663120 RepID=UPI001299FC48|nr:hypothetical protein [Chitinophaga sp. SYP-B3965]MRG43744.1 hypothetical protein [Chitinophaga sp. SYP-B3965]